MQAGFTRRNLDRAMPEAEGGRTMPDEEKLTTRFVDQVGEIAASLGMSRSVGQLYAALYMSPEPMSLDDLAEVCDMSKGNVSLNIRELERWGAARPVWVRGDRKDYYEAERDVPRIVIRRLKEGLGRRLSTLETALDAASEQIKQTKTNSKAKAFHKERLAEIRKLNRSLRRVLDNLDKFYEMGKRFL
jgi:DNA-binding transcriptional regulator GbsR (MarR family)